VTCEVRRTPAPAIHRYLGHLGYAAWRGVWDLVEFRIPELLLLGTASLTGLVLIRRECRRRSGRTPPAK